MPESGQYFVGKEPFRIGVSYWPRHTALDLWKQFDIDEVHEDFSIMSEVGINLARVALLWEDFQPDPTSVRCAALAHLLKLCDAAASEGVRLELLLFAGTVGNAQGFPGWLRADTKPANRLGDDGCCGLVNPFSDPLARGAAVNLVRGIARTVGSHPAVWAYNLGDRPDRLAPHGCHAVANAWFDELREVIHAVDHKHPVTCSLSGTNLCNLGAWRVDRVFSVLDHSTIDRDGLAADLGQSDSESQAVFSCALTTALTHKPCLLQAGSRVSGTERASPEQDAAGMQTSSVRALLDGLHRAGALGTVFGSFVDLPHQNSSGLVNGGVGLFEPDGQLRPHAEAIQNFARGRPCVEKSPPISLALGVSADEYYERPSTHVRRLYGEFLAG
jgi:hypothetical protein